MAEAHPESLDLFRRGPQILDASIAGISEAESLFAPFAGKWTIREIVRHLADTEIVVGMRLRQMISEERPLMATFDQDLWADRLHYNKCDPHRSAALFRFLREDISDILDALPAEEFGRVGLHPERGAGTLGEWVTRFGAHVEKHACQIRLIREAWDQR
ncbi:MAG TPA: DinB family protein [Bryobacteraceae bacterium]|nr:DinB family protein [Bryobacteraceae bacterium]